MYRLPKDIAPLVLFYRKDLYATYRLTPPTTWDEFRDTAQKVAKEHPGTTLANIPSGDAGLLAALAWQAGGHWFDSSGGHWTVNTTDRATLKMARYWQSVVGDKLVTTEPSFDQKHVTDLQKGRSLSLVAAPWTAANVSRFVPELKGKWGVVPLPNWPGHPSNANYGGSSLAMMRGAPHPDAAMEFIRWASTSPEAPESAAALSTAYPANTTVVAAAKRATTKANGYVAGMDLYGAAARAADAVDPSWEWGPDMTAGFENLNDQAASRLDQPNGIAGGLRKWEHSTIERLRQRGFDLPD